MIRQAEMIVYCVFSNEGLPITCGICEKAAIDRYRALNDFNVTWKEAQRGGYAVHAVHLTEAILDPIIYHPLEPLADRSKSATKQRKSPNNSPIKQDIKSE